MTASTSLVAAVCALTFVHFAAAQMRGPLVPLYAVAHGVTATGVGFIVAAHMALAGVASIPLGRASDVWGRRILLVSGMATSAVTSLLLPVVESGVGLAVIYGLAGLGVAAFTPSAMSLVGDAARPGAAGRAYAWYATAHYGAIGVGPFLGGLAAEWWGYRGAFVASAVGAAVSALRRRRRARRLRRDCAAAPRDRDRFAPRSDRGVWRSERKRWRRDRRRARGRDAPGRPRRRYGRVQHSAVLRARRRVIR